MRLIFTILSYVGLALTVIPGILVFTGDLELETHKDIMIAGMLIWFVFAIVAERLSKKANDFTDE